MVVLFKFCFCDDRNVSTMKSYDLFSGSFFFLFFFIFLYVDDIQNNQNMNNHTCLFLNTMPKYIHTNINHIYIYTINTDVINMHIHIYIYIHHTYTYIYTHKIYIYINKHNIQSVPRLPSLCRFCLFPIKS